MYTTLIDVESLASHLDVEDWLIVDCRFSLADTNAGQNAFNEGHIPSAIYAHLDDDLSGSIIKGETGRHPLPSLDKLTNLFSNWGIDETVQVIAYDDVGGMIASRLWWILRWLGHDKVAVLDGGWTQWQKKKLPITSLHESRSAKSFKPNLRADYLVDVTSVEANIKNASYLLVDSRTRERYLGEHEPIDPIAGRIPGAINAPHPENIGTDGLMKSPEALKDRFENIFNGKNPNEVIFYCGSGVSACRNLLALKHAGLGEAKLYAGSWSEWITNKEREIERG